MINIAMDSQILTNLMGCARYVDFYFNKNYISKRGKGNSLECGSMVHTIQEFYAKGIMSGLSRVNAIEQGLKAGMEYVRPYSPDNKFITDESHKGMNDTPEENEKTSGEGQKTGWKWVITTMEQYFDHYRNDSFTIIAAEETRKEIIYEDESIRILWKAKFDRIIDTPNGFISIDHKTMKRKGDTLSLNNQFMGQCVLLKARQVMIDKIGFQTSLKPYEKFERVLIPYSTDRLAEWINEILPHYARLYAAYAESENWPPNFTHCETKYSICQFKSICESDRNMREDELRINFDIKKEWDV